MSNPRIALVAMLSLKPYYDEEGAMGHRRYERNPQLLTR